MSVECRLLVGLTLEFRRDLTSEDFRRADVITERHPELDEYEYHSDDREGKLLLIGDGMNGQFLRLIAVDKLIDGGSLGEANDFIELPAAVTCFNKELVDKMSALYEEYTGEKPILSDFKYAIWSQWY